MRMLYFVKMDPLRHLVVTPLISGLCLSKPLVFPNGTFMHSEQ